MHTDKTATSETSAEVQRIIVEQFRGWSISQAAWLGFCVLSVAALSLYWGDSILGITAAVTGMMYTILAGKGKIACFLFGMINTPIYAYIAFKAGYYGDFSINLYYFAMMFPGIAAWRRHQSESSDEGIIRTSLSLKSRLSLTALCLAGIAAAWTVLHLLGGTRPFCDSVTNVLSIAAMLLTVRRAIEEWILWIIVNAVEVVMWWHAWRTGEGPVSVLLMWLLFLINGIYMLSLWIGVAANRRRKSGTVDS